MKTIIVRYDRGNVVADLPCGESIVIGFLDNEQRKNLQKSIEDCIMAHGWRIDICQIVI